jgi:hypothetical protein
MAAQLFNLRSTYVWKLSTPSIKEHNYSMISRKFSRVHTYHQRSRMQAGKPLYSLTYWSQVIRVFAARASVSRTIPSLAALQDRHVAQPSTSLLHFKRYTSNISRRSCLACNGTDRTKNLQQLCLVATLSKSTRPTSVIDYHNWQRMETVSRSGLMTRWLKSTAHLVATASRLRFACRYCS